MSNPTISITTSPIPSPKCPMSPKGKPFHFFYEIKEDTVIISNDSGEQLAVSELTTSVPIIYQQKNA